MDCVKAIDTEILRTRPGYIALMQKEVMGEKTETLSPDCKSLSVK